MEILGITGSPPKSFFSLVSVFVIYKLLRGTDFNSVFKLYMLAFLVFYTVVPGLSKEINFAKGDKDKISLVPKYDVGVLEDKNGDGPCQLVGRVCIGID